MAKIELNPGETLLKSGWGVTLQGQKLKVLVDTRFTLTDRRFIYHDLGGWAPLWSTMGLLLRLLVKGRRLDLSLPGLKLTRGKYAMNRDLLALTAPSGEQVLLAGFKKWTALLQEQLGARMAATGEEEWTIH
jgi:hypothetical protein